MNDNGAGCIVGLVVLVAIAWIPLHFSGKSILYGRTTVIATAPDSFGLTPATVTCHYFNSTGTEDKAKHFPYGSNHETYFCPRYKDVGQ